MTQRAFNSQIIGSTQRTSDALLISHLFINTTLFRFRYMGYQMDLKSFIGE